MKTFWYYALSFLGILFGIWIATYSAVTLDNRTRIQHIEKCMRNNVYPRELLGQCLDDISGK